MVTFLFNRPKLQEYLKFLFISLGGPKVALERVIFKLTKGWVTTKKMEH